MASSLASTSRQTLSSLRTKQSRALSTSSSVHIEIGRYNTPAAVSVPPSSASASSSASQPPTKASRELSPEEIELEAIRQRNGLRSIAKKTLEGLGSTQTRETSFRPHKARLDPVTARELTVSHLLASTAHVGHSVSSLTRASIPYLYGTRHGQAIIDVEKYTLPALRQACKIVKDVVYRDGVVIFLGTTPGTQSCILQAAKRLGKNGFHITKERWIPGVLTNAPKMLAQAILADMKAYEEQVAQHRGEEAVADATSLATLDLKPDLIIVFNPKNNVNAIREATALGIPTIGVIDTDVDPRLVTYAIPANDESIRTTELIAGLLSKAGEDGRTQRARKEDELDKKRRRDRQEQRRRPSRGEDGPIPVLGEE